jgi:hypothetical protein
MRDAEKMRIVRDPTVFWPFQIDPLPGACPQCAGRQVVLEQIDNDSFPVSVPCWRCTMICPACARRVLKQGHQCPQPQEIPK